MNCGRHWIISLFFSLLFFGNVFAANIYDRVDEIIEQTDTLYPKDYGMISVETKKTVLDIFTKTQKIIFYELANDKNMDIDKKNKIAEKLAYNLGGLLVNITEPYIDEISTPSMSRNYEYLNPFEKALKWLGWGFNALTSDITALVYPVNPQTHQFDFPRGIPYLGLSAQRTQFVRKLFKDINEDYFDSLEKVRTNNDIWKLTATSKFIKTLVKEANQIEPMRFNARHVSAKIAIMILYGTLAFFPVELVIEPTADSAIISSLIWMSAGFSLIKSRDYNSGYSLVKSVQKLKEISKNLKKAVKNNNCIIITRPLFKYFSK